MVGKIYLVRHGQSEDNAAGILGGRRDSDLTALGREQANKVAEKLSDYEIDVIYSSPLRRAYNTARIIADRLDIRDIIADDRLMERDFGVLSGKSYGDIEKYAEQVFHVGELGYFLGVEGAEDFPTLLERGRSILAEIKTKHPAERVLLSTHSDIGKMIRAAYYGWDWKQGLEAPNISNTDVLELSEIQDLSR